MNKVKTIMQNKKKAPTQLEEVISALNSLQASKGWAIVVKVLNDNITYLEKAILDKIDPITQQPISDKDIETLRIKRNLNIEVRDTPTNYSKELINKNKIDEPEEYDPYYQNSKQIEEDERKVL